jgi:hypothetical protein
VNLTKAKRPSAPPRQENALLTARASSDDKFPDFIIHEDEEGIGEGTEPPGRSASRIGYQLIQIHVSMIQRKKENLHITP